MPSSTTSSEPVRVLLVDDNKAMLARASAALSPACQVVGAVQDGSTALDAAKALRPDVIVLDISMPGMNGFELASQLHRAGSTAALVYLTVHDDQDFVDAARKAGAIGYVVKRRLATDLITAVREARARRVFVSVIR
jgi:DNA-binding NarL/FixJ family response regulator